MKEISKHRDDSNELISIIIPVYNGQPFIRDAYQVIINQNIEKFEIIFVNNNSTDNSTEIINDLVSIDSRVSLIHELVQGAAAARNKGLSQAKGGYIYFFDVDDELFEDAINALLKVLKMDKSLDSVHGNIVRSTLKLKDTIAITSNTNIVTVPEPYYWGIRWMNYGLLPNTGCFLHRRHVFDKMGSFNPQLKLGEDAAFHVKLGLECKVAHLDNNILLYYRHEQSTVSVQNKKQAKEFTYWKPLIYEHVPYLISHDVPLAFKKEVLIRVYGYIAKMLALTKDYNHRKLLRSELMHDIRPIKIPVGLQVFISLITVSGSLNLYKFYNYYVLKYYIKDVLR